jgi:hypothetical protein
MLHKVQYILRLSQLGPRVSLRPVAHKPTSTANPQANRFCPDQLVICTVANVCSCRWFHTKFAQDTQIDFCLGLRNVFDAGKCYALEVSRQWTT